MTTPTTEKHEIVCIARSGLSFVMTEGEDFAAKVTYLVHTPGEVYDPRKGVLQERLIPIPGHWG
jgi:hypothetical protein